MNFEEALVVEISSIPSLENKVFPLYAKEGIEPPFIVYISSEGERTQDLNGYANTKEMVCELFILAQSYVEMKENTKLVIDKIISFFGRSIGIDGPFIKGISYEQPDELHDKDHDYYRCSISMRLWV
jgi:hypothetical protein